MKPINLQLDPWQFEVFEFNFDNNGRLVLAGEAENYEACKLAMQILGVEERIDETGVGHWRTRYFIGRQQVFIRFTRVGDGARMTEYGTTREAGPERWH